MRAYALLIALLAGCAGSDKGPGTDDSGTSDADTSDTDTSDTDADTDADTDTDAGDSGAGAVVSVTLAEANPLAAIVTVTSAGPSRPVAVATRDGVEVARAEADSDASSHELLLIGLYADSSYDVTVTWEGEEHVEGLTTGPLPDLPAIEVTRAGSFDGIVAIPNGNGPIPPGEPLAFGVDAEGQVRWLYLTDTAFLELDPDVERLDDGSLRILSPDWARRVDMAGRTLTEIRAEDAGIEAIHHDARYLDDGGWLLLAHDYRDLPLPDGSGTEPWTGDELVRTDASGTVTWRWSTFDHMSTDDVTELADNPGPGVIGKDWTHANAILVEERLGGILLSLRNLHRILLIDPDTDEIVWSLGDRQDFRLDLDDGPGQWFFGGHAPEWGDDDTLLIFDNGLGRPGGLFSRVVRYQVDVDARTVREIWSHDIMGYSSGLGDVDTLSDTELLIDAGALSEDLHDPLAQLRIVDNEGRIQWMLDVHDFVYRAELLPLD